MAVEEKGLRAKIELKFKGKSISKNFKDNLAKKWAQKIETEEDVDSYIDDREDVILETASESDRIRTELAKKTTTVTETVKTEVEDEPTTEMGKLLKMVSGLTQTVHTMQQARTQETISQKFAKDERLKGIPAFMMKGRTPAKDEDYETAVEELVADWKPFVEKNKLEGFDGLDAPVSGEASEAARGKVKPIDMETAKKIVSS